MATNTHFIKNTDFYAAAAKNRRNTRWLFLCLMLILAIMGYLFGWVMQAQNEVDIWFFSSYGVTGTLIALVVGVIWIMIAVSQGGRIVMAINGGRLLQQGEIPQLENVVKEMSIAAGIPPPQIYFIDTPSMNAFATGMTVDKASVGITRGLLERLERDELQSVIAHEIGHVINADIRYATIVGVVVGMVAIVSDLMLRTFFWGEITGRRRRSSANQNNNGGQGLLMLFAAVFALLSSVAALFVQMAISREREYLADATSVRLTRNPLSMISALEKLSTNNPRMAQAKKATQHLYIVNPFHHFTARSSALFSTHPPIESRIERLKNLG